MSTWKVYTNVAQMLIYIPVVSTVLAQHIRAYTARVTLTSPQRNIVCLLGNYKLITPLASLHVVITPISTFLTSTCSNTSKEKKTNIIVIATPNLPGFSSTFAPGASIWGRRRVPCRSPWVASCSSRWPTTAATRWQSARSARTGSSWSVTYYGRCAR